VMLDGESVRKRMLDAVRSGDPRLRGYACTALGILRGPDAMEALKIALDDEDLAVRKSAVEGLARSADRADVLDALKLLLGERDPQLRLAVLAALLRINAEEALPSLELSLADPDPWVRFKTIKLTAQVRNGKTLDVLMRNYSNQDDAGRRAICDALADFPGKDKVVVPFLEEKKGQAGGDERLTQSISKALQKIRDRKSGGRGGKKAS
ncbi:MAG TPA: HEAT repeat domain-containing protein, partial [Elusimicrobiota bacterium]|nr:HEAT repeat domain-containing protein [Elusimicrobiota bacterium]